MAIALLLEAVPTMVNAQEMPPPTQNPPQAHPAPAYTQPQIDQMMEAEA